MPFLFFLLLVVLRMRGDTGGHGGESCLSATLLGLLVRAVPVARVAHGLGRGHLVRSVCAGRRHRGRFGLQLLTHLLIKVLTFT